MQTARADFQIFKRSRTAQDIYGKQNDKQGWANCLTREQAWVISKRAGSGADELLVQTDFDVKSMKAL